MNTSQLQILFYLFICSTYILQYCICLLCDQLRETLYCITCNINQILGSCNKTVFGILSFLKKKKKKKELKILLPAQHLDHPNTASPRWLGCLLVPRTLPTARGLSNVFLRMVMTFIHHLYQAIYIFI